ncbi:MAG: trk system potassium uptake protein TrkA [Halobacteriales archaeon]|jgi:trk system potassium uptake protein TrkA
MKYVITGYGRVGSRTARVLQEEGHDVAVIDTDLDRVERARNEGLVAVHGDASEESVLEEAGIATADAIAGLTPDLNVNFAACMIGKHHGCRTVLRINEDYREEIYEKYASDVDEVVYPERLGAAGAKTALLGGDFNLLSDLTEDLQMMVFTIGESSPVVGERIATVDLPESGRIYAHGRRHEPMKIPLPGTEFRSGDQVAVVVERETVEEVRKALVGE